MNCTGTNGRINIMDVNTASVFTHQDHIPVKECSSYRDAMTGTWNSTSLSNAFFSKKNIENLQNQLRMGVYKKSNGQYKIGQQDCNELMTIMRSIFLQYAKNLPENIPEQISKLNQRVLDYSIKQVYNELLAYTKYKQDVSTIACPISLPEMSRPNNKQLIFNHRI